ncbi:unnamed protein product [Discosporangium mesarthrocarpum]
MKSPKPSEPPAPGTGETLAPPAADSIAFHESVLTRRVTDLLRASDDDENLLLLLLEAGSRDRVDTLTWLTLPAFRKGRTALMEAGVHDRPRCVAMLSQVPAQVNARNRQRDAHTPLHYAAYYGASSAALELLANGADPTIRNHQGETAIEAAIAGSQRDCAEVIRDFLRRPAFALPPQYMPPSATVMSENSAAGEPPTAHRARIRTPASCPEVARENFIFCLARKRRRMAVTTVPLGLGLGVGVGSLRGEEAVRVRRGAKFHAINPFAGTFMEHNILRSLYNCCMVQ